MTKRKLEAYRRLYNRLEALGFDGDEADALCRIERTLHRWAELECNGEVQRDDKTGKPFAPRYAFLEGYYGLGPSRRAYVPDREAGALRRLSKIMAAHPGYTEYYQTDPRGCALYIVPNEYLPDGTDISAVYTNGIAVCV